MPTNEAIASFWRDWAGLSAEDQRAFRAAVQKFVEDMKTGRGLRKGLRVKGVQGARGIYELSWAQNGRATFEYGKPVRDGEPHIIWRRIGDHGIFDRP